MRKLQFEKGAINRTSAATPRRPQSPNRTSLDTL